jgi:hypothetical protein
MPRPKGSKNKPKGSPLRPVRPRERNNMGRGNGPNTKRKPSESMLTLKEGVMLAYQGMGGWRELMAWGKANPHDFYTKILVKLLPLEVDVRKSEPITVEVNLHKKKPLVLDNDTGCEVVPENAVIYPTYPGVVSRG